VNESSERFCRQALDGGGKRLELHLREKIHYRKVSNSFQKEVAYLWVPIRFVAAVILEIKDKNANIKSRFYLCWFNIQPKLFCMDYLR
jgi:hypothetical protein